METLLVDKPVADKFLPDIARGLFAKNVELRVDAAARAIVSAASPQPASRIKEATEQDFYTEYNDYVLNVRVVDGIDEAVNHISHYGSAHSDAIVTGNKERAERFLREVDSAAVYWNASTRFTDGGEFGMGAEIGISTDKVGARGPMGLAELTTYKWIGYGTGQVRT
jgi:glutamate-5-semialdehyde dehydrogenase